MNNYVIHMYWGGWDPDGEVAVYQYVITDNPLEGLVIDNELFEAFEDSSVWTGKWSPERRCIWNGVRMYGGWLVANDSIFVFSADLPADTTDESAAAEFLRSHTFFLRAVDDEGTPSRRPAYRSFTARTLSPKVQITVPSKTSVVSPARVPPIATFKWKAWDYIDNIKHYQDPDSVRWILKPYDGDFDNTLEYIRRNPNSPEWYPWTDYKAPGDSGKFWISYKMDIGERYVFAIQVKDEAGAVTPVFDENLNVRRLLASWRTTGPYLELYQKYIGTVSGATLSTPLRFVDLPEGVPLSFTWTATAEHYGAIVVGYRYGWDVIDLEDDSQWDIDYTPFAENTSSASSPPRTFYFGTHTFYVEVKDNSGFRSRVGIRINIIPFTMQRDILLVDDCKDEGTGMEQSRGAGPNDEEHDEFWIEVLSGVENFNPALDVVDVTRTMQLPITSIANYKAVIWNTYGMFNLSMSYLPLLYQVVQFRRPGTQVSQARVVPNILALYLAAGGKLLLCGFQPMTMSVNRAYFSGATEYPLICRYELGGNQGGNYRDGPVGEESFAYRDYCLNVLDVAYGSWRRNYCKTGRRSSLDDGLRECVPEDPSVFPTLRLRPEATGENDPLYGDQYSYHERGLNSELYNPDYFRFCPAVEMDTTRACIEVMYRQKCNDQSSDIYYAPIAIWSSTFADVIPPKGVPGRSVMWGFEPFYFNPSEVKQALETIFREWEIIE